MADERAWTEGTPEERLEAASLLLSAACLKHKLTLSKRVAHKVTPKSRKKFSAGIGKVDLNSMSLEDVLDLAIERLAPKIQQVIEAVDGLGGASMVLRLELPCREHLSGVQGNVSPMLITVPLGSLADTASERMRRATQIVVMENPKDAEEQAVGHLLRAFELGGGIRWTNEAYKQRMIADRPMIGVGMADVDAVADLKGTGHAPTFETVD